MLWFAVGLFEAENGDKKSGQTEDGDVGEGVSKILGIEDSRVLVFEGNRHQKSEDDWINGIEQKHEPVIETHCRGTEMIGYLFNNHRESDVLCSACKTNHEEDGSEQQETAAIKDLEGERCNKCEDGESYDDRFAAFEKV